MEPIDFEDYSAKLNDLSESMKKLQSVTESLRETNDAIGAKFGAVEQYVKDLAKLNDSVQELSEQVENNRLQFLRSIEGVKAQMSEKLGLPLAEIKFDDVSSSPVLTNYVADVTSEFTANMAKVQDSVGESGKPIQDSPNTSRKMLEKIGKFFEKYTEPYLKIMIYLSALSGGAGLLSMIANAGAARDLLKKNPKLSTMIPQGCYQYEMNSGSIRTLGVCGLQDTCSSKSNKNDCLAVPNKVCDWDGQCVVAKKILSADTCCATCDAKTPCTSPNPKKCSNDTDCLSGKCVGGVCQYQTCDPKTNTCGPCPSLDPNYSILQQVKDGKLGFCLSGIPNTICPATSLVCRGVSSGGACSDCADNDPECISPSKTLLENQTCACKPATDPKSPTNWITAPVCTNADDLIIFLAYMNSVSEQWVPSSTPVVIYIIAGLSFVILLLTMVKYIMYLFHQKR